MKVSDIREKTTEELHKLATELAEEIRAMETAIKTNVFTRNSELGVLKKTRARILTILAHKRTITHS